MAGVTCVMVFEVFMTVGKHITGKEECFLLHHMQQHSNELGFRSHGCFMFD